MDINKLIAFRRAVYPSQFNKGEIDKATLDQLLENANMAPTHKMTQPWFFKVYKIKQKPVALLNIPIRKKIYTNLL